MRLWLPALVLAAAACSADRAQPDRADTVHAVGIIDPTSSDFHPLLLRSYGWDLSVCMRCHDQTKANPAPDCGMCHQGGATACTTCHGQPPATGAHAGHVKGDGPDACRKCHFTPHAWSDDGHIYTAGVLNPSPAVITFGDLASTTPDPAQRHGAPTWDGTKCSNVYCHGGAFDDAAAANTTPAWYDGPAQATCGNCHGKPPANHGANTYACSTCHPADAPHVNGVVDVKNGHGCGSCHGSDASPAPPTDLSGNQYITAIGVGAHQAHLTGAHKLAAPVPCNSCHAVPTKVFDVGHIDSGPPAEVLASVGWDRNAQTCTTAWCHKVARPIWTKTGEAYCGSCHGIPPADAAHAQDPPMQLTDCIKCHKTSVDAFGAPLVTNGPNGPTSEHINGQVDL